MTTPKPQDVRARNLDNLKQAVMSIAICAVISIITVVFQELLNWLQTMDPQVPGAVVGIARFYSKWKPTLHV